MMNAYFLFQDKSQKKKLEKVDGGKCKKFRSIGIYTQDGCLDLGEGFPAQLSKLK